MGRSYNCSKILSGYDFCFPTCDMCIKRRSTSLIEAAIDKAAALIDARPYIQAFRGKMVVVKYGGSTMVDAGQVDTVPEDIAFMQSVGIRPVGIHGGGPAISERLEEQGVETTVGVLTQAENPGESQAFHRRSSP